MTRAASPLRDRIIFLVGARRSGTNWLQRVIGSHPDVFAVPHETYLFSRGIKPLAERFQHGAIRSAGLGTIYIERDTLLDALRGLCDTVFAGLNEAHGSTARRILERTPEHARVLELIGDVYPDARFVHIIRDGRDVARSLLAQEWGPASIEEAAAEWRSTVEAARATAKGLAHYREVRYEELLADPRGQVVALFEWLGLPTEPASLEGSLLEASMQASGDTGSPSASIAKWKHSLSGAERRAFEVAAGELLVELGYEPSSASEARPNPMFHQGAGSGRRIRASIGRRLRGRRARADGGFERTAHQHLSRAQALFDRVMAAIAARRFDDLLSLLSPTVRVRLVVEDGEWQGRGREGIERFLQSLADDEAMTGRQRRGDVHPAVPTFVAVLTYELPGGGTADRVLVLTIQRDVVERVAYYRLTPRPA